ncbi:hypothetical protein [Corynebacterium rhinophilum]|uniref:hypothetical protein n=1 Tax=Corynebacterium rhinophilum TaxID=3050197 RepID=UPI00254C982A|nr:hypothetical protein [Corynebacterium sp. MSK082]MDK8646622.1 hypothetical protein [Corynebacterium sp. MSK082]
MTDLTTTHLQHLLDQATPGPWTVKENKWDEIIIGNRAGHARALGEQVRFLFEAGHPEADTELAVLAPQLAEEVIRQRGEIKGLITAMEVKAATGESQSPATIAGYLKEIVLGETNE